MIRSRTTTPLFITVFTMGTRIFMINSDLHKGNVDLKITVTDATEKLAYKIPFKIRILGFAFNTK